LHECDESCSGCLHEGHDGCLKCNDSFVPSKFNWHNMTITCECPYGYDRFGDYETCEKCHDSCYRCDGPEEDDCTMCSYTRYLEDGEC